METALNQRANFQKKYLLRYLLMAGIGLFMAVWFAFDGFIGYPREQQRAAAYEKLQSEIKDKSQLKKQWRELAKSQGWSTIEPSESSAEFADKITGQYVFGSLCLILVVPSIALFFRSRNRWVERTATGLTTSWGQSMRFADVVLLNKRRWQQKGIAKAYYKQDGKEYSFVFDDFKYDREPLDAMLVELEAALRPEQIVGGPPEPTDPPKAADANSSDETLQS
jgi:hypothetical protein